MLTQEEIQFNEARKEFDRIYAEIQEAIRVYRNSWSESYRNRRGLTAENFTRLNQFYRDMFGTNFNPVVPDTVLQGGYRELVNELLDIELTSMNDLRSHTYFQSDYAINEYFRKMADSKMNNIIILLSILENYNYIQIEQLQKQEGQS